MLSSSALNVGSKQLELVVLGYGSTIREHDKGPQSFLGLK